MIVHGSTDGTLNRMRAHGQRGPVAGLSVVVDDDVRDLDDIGAAPAAAGASAVVGSTPADVDLKHFGVIVFQIVQVDAVFLFLCKTR